MEQSLAVFAADRLARSQLQMFTKLCEQADLTFEDSRRALGLEPEIWRAWRRFQTGGPRPSMPPLPDLLRQVAETASGITVSSERRTAA